VIVFVVVIVARTLIPMGGSKTDRRELRVPVTPLSLDGAIVMGDRRAEAVVLEFSDFECPFCAKFGTEIFPLIEKEYLSTGKVMFVFRQLPLQIHRNAEGAARAAICAGEQAKFKPLHDLMFQNYKTLDAVSIEQFAFDLGIEPDTYRDCLQSRAPEKVSKDVAIARSLGVTGTPAFFFGRVDLSGRFIAKRAVTGARPLREFETAINEILDAK